MTDNLGPEIKIDGKRPDWLADDELIGIVWRHSERWGNLDTPAYCVHGWEYSVVAIMLRADHPYYLATSKGFTYWPGGKNAPDDCDNREVLFRDGLTGGEYTARYYGWRHQMESADIIGYRKRAEDVEDNDDYIRVKRMTLDEAYEFANRFGGSNEGCVSVLSELDLIRCETPIDQFERDHGGLDNNQRNIVEAFIEWQKGNEG